MEAETYRKRTQHVFRGLPAEACPAVLEEYQEGWGGWRADSWEEIMRNGIQKEAEVLPFRVG